MQLVLSLLTLMSAVVSAAPSFTPPYAGAGNALIDFRISKLNEGANTTVVTMVVPEIVVLLNVSYILRPFIV
jgi:hypothetical protein